MSPEQMEERIRVAFPESQVVVMDLTGTSDHFELRVSHAELKKLSRIAQHQAIMAVFADELKTGEVHALTIKVI